jgi:hypothetical protein
MLNAVDRIVLVVIGMLGLVAASGCSTAREWSRPYGGDLPGTEPDTVSITIVRDAVTGAPLAGVRLRQYLETIDPRTPRAPLLAEATTDEFGIASVYWAQEIQDCHWVFEKPGYAVTETYGGVADRTVDLPPGRELHGVLHDPFGRPYGGVAIELFLGCGHSPAVRRAVTDKRGQFCLRDVEPDMGTLWYPADGIAADYLNGPRGTRERPLVITPDPGRIVTGRVVDEDGRPVPGAVIRSRQEFRGPVARSSEDGRFRLTGFEPSGDLNVHGPAGGYAWVDGESIDFARSLTVVLRADGDNDGRRDWKAKPVRLRFEIVDADSGAPVTGARVSLHRAEDGRVFWANLAVEDTVDAPPGEYELTVGNAFSSHAATQRFFTVEAGDRAVHRIKARARPTLALELTNFPEDHALLELVLAEDSVLIPQGDKAGPIFVPAEARAVVRASAEGLVRHYPVGPVENGRRRVTIEWPRKKRVKVDFDAEGKLSLREAWSVQTDQRTLETHAGGRATLVVRDEELGRREIPIVIPYRGGDEVEVHRKGKDIPGLLTVSLSDGAPAAGCRVRVDGERFTLDEQGTLTSWRVRPGAVVVVRKAGHVELRRTLESAGPHRIAWGGASLEVNVPKIPEFVVYVDGQLFTGKQGRLLVPGLDLGQHLVIVAAHGNSSQAMQIVLEEAETRALEVLLTAN